MPAILSINPIGFSVTWSLALLDKCRPFFLRDVPLTPGTEQLQDPVPASKTATEKRRSLRTKPHTLSSSFPPLQADESLTQKGKREEHEDCSTEVPPGENREGYCLRT